MNQQSMSAILSQVATVVSVSKTSLGMKRKDKQASKESDRLHNALVGASSVNVSRMPGEGENRVADIDRVANEYAATVNLFTTQWEDKRLLANTNIEVLLAALGPIKLQWERLVQAFRDDAQRLIQLSEYNKGTYHVAPPTVEEIDKAFSIDFRMSAIPDTSNYKSSGLGHEMEEELRRRFEANIEVAYQNAQKDAFRRLAEPLAHLAESMAEYTKKEVGDEPRRMYASVIGNVQQIAAVFGSFNLTNDPLMGRISQALRDFEGIDVDALKEHRDLRDATARKAQEILESLGDWIK